MSNNSQESPTTPVQKAKWALWYGHQCAYFWLLPAGLLSGTSLGRRLADRLHELPGIVEFWVGLSSFAWALITCAVVGIGAPPRRFIVTIVLVFDVVLIWAVNYISTGEFDPEIMMWVGANIGVGWWLALTIVILVPQFYFRALGFPKTYSAIQAWKSDRPLDDKSPDAEGELYAVLRWLWLAGLIGGGGGIFVVYVFLMIIEVSRGRADVAFTGSLLLLIQTFFSVSLLIKRKRFREDVTDLQWGWSAGSAMVGAAITCIGWLIWVVITHG